MIDLISYNVTYGDRFNNDRTDNIKIHYKSYLEKGTKVRIYLEDDIFNTESQYQDLNLGTGIFWSQFSSKGPHPMNNDRQITTPFSTPQKLIFFDEKGNTIKDFKLDIRFVDESLRGKNQKKCAWIIGDSHIGNLCKDINYDSLEYENIRLNPICRLAVTMSRFYKSNFLEYLSHFPIQDNDILLFKLGEIDIRRAIHVKSYEKNISKNDLLTNIVFNYYMALKQVKEKYPNNKIIILRPNYPIPEQHVTETSKNNHFFKHSNELDTIRLNQQFDEIVKSLCNVDKDITYLDNTSQYEKNGFTNVELLLEQDIHMKSNKQYFDSLYEKLKNL